MNTPLTFKDLPPTLKASVWDAVFFFIMFGAGESYLTAYGVYLGLSAFEVGLLTTFPLFVGALSQLVGVKLMEAHISRRTQIVYFVFFQSLSWLLIISIPWLSLPENLIGYVLILAVTLYFISGQIILPGWTSLMGDLVPEHSRGKYFGLRSKICGYFMMASFLAAGYVIKIAEQKSFELYGFALIFFVAFIARSISGYFLSKHDDPAFVFTVDDKFSFWRFLQRAPKSNFAQFTLFHGLFHLAIFIAGPYFILYMLRELELSYWEYTLVVTAWLVTNFLMMEFWGRFGDSFGNRRVIAFCAYGLCFIPIAWVFSGNLTYLILLQLVSGIFTAGLQLGSLNFLFDAVTPGKRGRCTAYLWVINATCIVIGSLIGSLLLALFEANRLNAIRLFDSPYLSLFVIASCARMAVALSLLSRFKEVRTVDTPDYSRRFYRISRIQPLASAGIGAAVGVYRNKLRPLPSKRLKKNK